VGTAVDVTVSCGAAVGAVIDTLCDAAGVHAANAVTSDVIMSGILFVFTMSLDKPENVSHTGNTACFLYLFIDSLPVNFTMRVLN